MSQGWQTVTVGDVCVVRKGTSITERQTEPGDVPVVAGGIRHTYTHARSNRSAGAVTVSASGANAGYVNYWSVPIFASDCTTIEPADDTKVDRRFLFHQLKSLQPRIQSTLRRGAALPHVYPKDIAALEIVMPAMGEQERVAALLDSADSIRRQRSETRAKLAALVGSIYVELCTRCGSGDWEFQSLESLAEDTKDAIRTGPFGSQLLHDEFTDEGIAVLGIDNAVSNRFAWGQRRFITEEKYEQLKRYTVFPGDVLVTIMGTCGRVAIVPDDIPTAINTKHLCCVSLDRAKCLPEWLWASIQFHPDVRQQLGATHGAVMPGLNMGKIKGARIPLPPMAVQEAFAFLKAAVERHEDLVEQAGQRCDVLLASLRQRAFRGEL